MSAARQAAGIPAFARKYRFSCSTCHAPFPRLKPYGEEFAGRGFRLEDPAQEPPRAVIQTGDPSLSLLRELPLAVRIEGFGQWNEKGPTATDAQFPWIFKVLSGSALSKTFSYYFYAIIEEGEVIGLEDAYVQINDPFGAPVSLAFGQFQVCDPLFKRELRLSRFDYQIYKTRVGQARVNLAYDRGIMLSGELPGGVESVFQIVNGNGIGSAEDGARFDTDSEKNLSVRLARGFGPVRLGVFGYWGRERSDRSGSNRTYYVGPDLSLTFGQRAQLNAQYLERRDDNPLFESDPGSEWKTRGGFAELLVFPEGQDGRWALSALVNVIDSDDDAAKWRSYSLAVSRLLARNVRLVVEGGREMESEEARISLGLVMAF
jgi:hypothetical protein